MSLEIPEGAQQVEQIKYEEGLKEIVSEMFKIFRDRQLLLHDINNVMKLINLRLTKATSLLNINYIENSIEGVINNAKENGDGPKEVGS